MLSPAKMKTLPVLSSSRTTKIGVKVLVRDWHSVIHMMPCSAVGKIVAPHKLAIPYNQISSYSGAIVVS
jgi:hypothetical protein